MLYHPIHVSIHEYLNLSLINSEENIAVFLKRNKIYKLCYKNLLVTLPWYLQYCTIENYQIFRYKNKDISISYDEKKSLFMSIGK